jgi:hypothetical protein
MTTVDLKGPERRVLRKSDQIVTRELAGETILVPIRGTLASLQQIFVLNPVAAFIWEQLDGERSLDEICEGILERFDATPATARGDLLELVEGLLAAGLIAEPPRVEQDSPGSDPRRTTS